MISSLEKGKSVDNGLYKRKNLKFSRYDQLVFDEGIFAAAVSSKGVEPVDERAIFRIDLTRFLKRLSRNERMNSVQGSGRLIRCPHKENTGCDL